MMYENTNNNNPINVCAFTAASQRVVGVVLLQEGDDAGVVDVLRRRQRPYKVKMGIWREVLWGLQIKWILMGLLNKSTIT